MAIAAGAALSVSGVVGSMSLVQAWHPRPDVHFAVNPVAWTLSVEAFFYLTFPALIGLLARLRRRGLLVVMASCVMATVSWAAVGHFSAPDGRHWVVYVFPLARLPEFVLGMAVGCAMRRGELPRVRLSVAVLTASAAWAIGLTLPSAFQVAALLVVPFAAVVVASTQADLRGPAGGFLRAPAAGPSRSVVVRLLPRARTRHPGPHAGPRSRPCAGSREATRRRWPPVAAVAASAALVAVVERPMHDLLRGGRGGSRRVVSTWLGRLSPVTGCDVPVAPAASPRRGDRTMREGDSLRDNRAGGQREVPPMRRAAAIGLDAMEWAVAERLMAEGHMPNLRALRERGTSCRLENVVAYRSELPWTLFLTGRSASANGYWSTVDFDPATYAAYTVGAHPVPPFYALEDQCRVIAFDVPHSVPDPKVHGIQVTAWGAHSPQFARASRAARPAHGDRRAVRAPPRLRQRLRRRVVRRCSSSTTSPRPNSRVHDVVSTSSTGCKSVSPTGTSCSP